MHNFGKFFLRLILSGFALVFVWLCIVFAGLAGYNARSPEVLFLWIAAAIAALGWSIYALFLPEEKTWRDAQDSGREDHNQPPGSR